MEKRQKWWFGHSEQLPDHEVHPITVEAPEGSTVEIATLQCLNDSFDIMIVDGRLGDRLLPWEGPIDAAFFKNENSEFRVGDITPDAPLKLYVQVWGFRSSLPHFNFVLTGYLDHWEAPVVKVKDKKKVGEVVLKDYIQWLKVQGVPQDRHPLFVEPLNHYMSGTPLPESAKTPGFEVLAKYLEERDLLDRSKSGKKKGGVIPPITNHPKPNSFISITKTTRTRS